MSGTIRITIDGVARDYSPGDVVVIEPGVVHSFLNPAKEPVVINVSLDGTRMEDAFVPVAVASLGREPRLSDVLTMMCALVDPYPSTPAIPFHRTLMPMLVGTLNLLGFKRLAPVEGWDTEA